MVTFLDSGLLTNFSSIFIFIFVWVAVYALLNLWKIFGDNQGINSIVALVLALLFSISGSASKIFERATPWLVFTFVVIIFLSIMLKFMNAEEILFKNHAMAWIVVIVVLITFMIAAGQVSQEAKQQATKEGKDLNATQTFGSKIGETLRNPAILGLFLIFLIATFAVMLLSGSPAK